METNGSLVAVKKLVLFLACVTFLSSCSTKNLSKEDSNAIKTVSINIDHITTGQEIVGAIGFWWGVNRYNDFVPLLENDKLFAKVFRQAMVYQIDSNGLWKVVNAEKADVDFFFEYSLYLYQTADTKSYQMIMAVIGRMKDKDGNVVWKKDFQSDSNPYSNEKVVYPLQAYYKSPIALKHAIGAASVQLSADFIEDLGGTFHLPQFAIWEAVE